METRTYTCDQCQADLPEESKRLHVSHIPSLRYHKDGKEDWIQTPSEDLDFCSASHLYEYISAIIAEHQLSKEEPEND